MKRTLAAILVVILCLSLCACSGVKQEDYDAAVAKYDALSEEHEALKEKVEPYAAVIDALEAEDYDGAIAAVEAMRPTPEVTEVEITMDNLWDYFEITEIRNEKTDAAGNIIKLDIQHCLSLKDEYNLSEAEGNPTDIAIGCEYDIDYTNYHVPCTIDFSVLTCTGSVLSHWNKHESVMVHFPESIQLDYSFAQSPVDQSSGNLATIRLIENFNVLNASGTLYLINK